ncbi:hypothetical protein B566_EDAN015604 [Ephemera danica]|nr:hypothetical protein B566_EDAN015604 [Ephemera danica]
MGKIKVHTSAKSGPEKATKSEKLSKLPGKKNGKLFKLAANKPGKVDSKSKTKSPGKKAKQVDQSGTAQNEVAGNNKSQTWEELKSGAQERKLVRKNAKFAKHEGKFFEILGKAKKIWEELRRKDCSAEKKQELAKSLHDLFHGNYRQLVGLHDMARIVQWIIKLGTEQINSEILSEIEASIVQIVQQKYANYCIKELLEHGGSRKVIERTINGFIGHTMKLLLNNHSANIVAAAYEKFANAEQKCLMKQDLYGDVFKVFKSNQIKSLADSMPVAGAMKNAILNGVYTNVLKFMEKDCAKMEIVHSLAWELFHQLDVNSTEHNDLRARLLAHIHQLSTSKNGAWLSMHCLWLASAKQRKESMKLCREHLDSIMTSENGHLTLMAMFDCVDDTVLLSKIILDPIVEKALEYSKGESSMKVLQYLTVHRDTQFFHPGIIKSLSEGDNNKTSKKPMKTRRSEILQFVSNKLLENVSSNLREWLVANNSCMVLRAIFKSGSGETLGNAYSQLATLITSQDSILNNSEDAKSRAVEQLHIHKMLRMLITLEKKCFQSNPDDPLLSKYIVEHLGPELLWWLDINRGAFILVVMLETEIPEVMDAVFTFLKPYEAKIDTSTVAGTKVLVKKMKESK